MAVAVYLACTLTSLACAILLWRGYSNSGFRLLLWSALCFAGVFLNNLVLVIDLMLLPDIDVYVFRLGLALLSVVMLLIGLVWESK